MRQNQNAKRSRGRGRRSGNSGQNSFNRNTTFESNGPEGRLRGNAQQLFEKYTSLANDAQSSGERVLFEANSQFADHYYRIQQSILANAEQRRQNDERSPRKPAAKQDGEKHGDEDAKQASSDSPEEANSEDAGEAVSADKADEVADAPQSEDETASADADVAKAS